MADGMTVPGIQASFGLDTTELDSALQKVRSGMDSAAEKIRNAQSALENGSLSALEFAKAVRQAENEAKLLAKTAESLESQIQAQKSAVSESISFASSWTSAIKEGSRAASDYKQQLQDMAALQAHLGQMDARTNSHETELQQLQEMSQLQAALAAMEERSASASKDAEAARVSGLNEGKSAIQGHVAALEASAAAAKAAADAAAEYKQQLADMAALQAHLGQMEARQAANETEIQAEQEMIELQAALAAMEQRTADASKEAEAARVQGLQRGKAAIKEVTDAIDAENAAIQQTAEQGARSQQTADNITLMAQAMNKTSQANATAAPMMMRSTAAINAQSAAFAAGKGMAFQYTAAMAGVGPMSSRAGMAMMQLGYIVDDIQYGFHSIVNNVGPLVMSMTGNAGIAGAAQIATVALGQLPITMAEVKDAMNWGGFANPLIDGLNNLEQKLKDVNKQIDEFKGRTSLGFEEKMKLGMLQDQQKELKQQIKDKKAYEGLMEGSSKEQKARGSAFEDTFQTFGSQEGHDLLVDALKGKELRIKGRLVSPEKYVEDLLSRAAQGDEESIKEVHTYLNGSSSVRAGVLERKLTEGSPERKKEDARDKEHKKRVDREAKRLEQLTNQMIAEEKQADEETKRARRENLKAAKDAIPGVEKRTQGRIRESGDQTQALTKELMGLGFSEDDAKQAAHDLNHEASNKVTAENQDPEYQRQQRHRARQRGLEAVPGLNKMAEQMELQGIAQGMQPEQIWKSVTGRIRDALSKAGLKGDELNNATSEIAAQADRDLKKEVVKEALKEPEIRHSEVFDASEINRRVQQSVGGDPHKKAETQRERMIKYLATMAQANGNVLKLEIDE